MTKVRRAFWIICTVCLCPWLVAADELPGFHVGSFAFKQARIVTAPGQVVERATLLVQNGKIAAIGVDVEIPANAEVIDAEGLTIYPGFIDAGATALLDEARPPVVEGRSVDIARYALAGMRSDYHSGLTPDYLATEHLRLSPQELDKYRQAGFVAVNVLPSGRIASGQGVVTHLATLPVRETILKTPSYSVLQLFERGGGEYPSTNMGIHAHLRQTFLDAERHAKQQQLFAAGVSDVDRPAADAVLEAFQELRAGGVRPLFIAQTRDDHERALNFAAEHQLQIAIWGGQEAYRLAERLKKQQTDVILHVDFGDEPKVDAAGNPSDPYADLPHPQSVREHERQEWKTRVGGLAELHKQGVRFALSSRDGRSPADLLKAMRQAIANGLEADAALGALTTDAAAILGVDKQLGILAPGRPAYFVVMTGPFHNEQSRIRQVVIDGRRFEYNKDAKPIEPTKPGEARPLQVAGNWALDIDAGDGKLHGQLELTQNDKSLTGKFQSDQGDGRLTAGTVSSDALEFTVSIGAGDAAIQLKFDTAGWSKPAGATPPDQGFRPPELSGTLKSPFGAPTRWTARRNEPSPPSSPAVQVTHIETPESSATTPASAAEPANSAAASAQAVANNAVQPVEFPEHRRARSITTGGNVLIQHGTVLTATGLTLPNHSIKVQNGTITAIGPDLQPEPGMTVLDATGRYVMPGIIDTHSHIMISNGIGGVNEATASIVCEVRVRDVINTADPSEYRALAGGVTTARLLHGSANCIGGQDAVVQLKHGTPAAEHLFPGAHSGVKFALGENVKFRGGRFPNTRLGVEATLNRAFLEALDYRRGWMAYEQARRQSGVNADNLLPPRRDLRLEALSDILNHQKFIHSHCYRADEILMLLRVAENHGIRVWSLQHVLEGYKVAPEIVKHGASCSTFADWWAYKVEAFDAVPQNAALLHEAGANACIKSDDWELIRHLYLEAAKTVRYGNMPPDAALQAITLNPARELHLDDRLGSIEVGKQADLAIFSGHPLNAFSRCEQTLIAGEVYFTRDKQPSVMSSSGATSSAKPAELHLPKPEDRVERLDLQQLQQGTYAIVGATLHPVDAEDIPGGTMVVVDGKIAALGTNVAVPPQAGILSAPGLHIYPGLIDAGTSVGLIEIGKVRETSDLSEIGQFQSDLRAGIGVNPDSELIPVARAGGVITTLCLPAGGANMTSHDRAHGAIISGQASVLQLAGWTMPEMVVNMEAGLHLLWPRGGERKGAIDELKQHLKEAQLYEKTRNLAGDAGGVSRTLIDPRYEALRPYLRGEKPVFIEADTRQEIVESLHFADEFKLKVILCGVTDGWKVADKIKAANVSVVVGPTMRKPVEEYDPFDAPYANAGRLHEAGVKLCFRSDTASNSRNTPFEAAMAVAYGLPASAALRDVTLTSAEILGVADQVGSLTAGKWANFIITDGSPLQQTTQIKGVVVQGRPYQPESRQTRFYDKYRTRLKP